MATTQRPLKEGSVRTYQEKVGLGFVDILASEMDADLDGIYGAWNGGVDSVTLKDGAVTTPKLAPDVQVLTTATNPVQWGPLSIKGRLIANATLNGTVHVAVNQRLQAADAGWTQDDPTKPSWEVLLRADNDTAVIGRLAPGGAASAPLIIRGSDGKTVCSLADATVTKPMLAPNVAMRNLVGATIPQNWVPPSKNAWNAFAAGVMSTVGGSIYCLVSPAWEWFTSATTANSVQVAIDYDTTTVYWRVFMPNGVMTIQPLPSIAYFGGVAAGTHTFTVKVFCETNSAIITPNTPGIGSILFIECS